MLTFFDFPKRHWRHLRTTNVVESPFASVRLRANAAKRSKKVAACLLQAGSKRSDLAHAEGVAEKRFRRLDAPHLLPAVYAQHHRENKITIDSGEKLAA